MPRQPEQPLTEEEKFKLQEQQEQELQNAQRQYALLEKDRQLFTCGAKLGRLTTVLNVFKKEYGNIETDLEVATAHSKKRQDSKDAEHLSKLLEDHDFYEEEVTKERKYIQEIDGMIRMVEKEVVKLRSMQITDRQHEERVWHAITTVEQLWNKIDVQNTKFGTICAKNRAMKAEIRRMLWERDVFMKVWNKMINKLVMGKKFMMDLIEQATIAYDQREEWVSKLQALRLKAHYDFILHTQEMRELKRKQDNDKKLEQFFDTKGKKRVMMSLQEKERMKRIEYEIATREKLRLYREYMNDIYEFTKKSQVEEIARKYYIQEAENFSLFKHINNIIKEIEFLGDQLGDIQTEISEERQLHDARNFQQKSCLESLQTELETSTHVLEETDKELHDVENYIKKMLEGIDQLFKICRCDKDPILNLLGNNEHINPFNASLYIKIIENAAHKALVDIYNTEKNMYDKKKITGAQRIVIEDRVQGELKPLEALATTNPCPLCIEHECVSDVIDKLQFVMTREQAKAALAERLKTPEYADHLHNVSQCFLPKSREIIQRRYQ